MVHQMYKWVDAYARPVSPPPELELIGQLDSLGRRSGFSLLKGTDERKVGFFISVFCLLDILLFHILLS